MGSFEIETKRNVINVNYFFSFVPRKDVKIDKELFGKMCMSGCKNYNRKYSCPPFVPDFDVLLKDFDGLFIVLFLAELSEIDSTEYNKVRIANSVMKSRIKRLMNNLEQKFNATFLSSGSCNLCRPCRCRLNLPCKYPSRRRYSLEAAGVDCNELSKRLFRIPLLWYQDKKAPKYTCVMCGLLCRKSDLNQIESELEKYAEKKSL